MKAIRAFVSGNHTFDIRVCVCVFVCVCVCAVLSFTE